MTCAAPNFAPHQMSPPMKRASLKHPIRGSSRGGVAVQSTCHEHFSTLSCRSEPSGVNGGTNRHLVSRAYRALRKRFLLCADGRPGDATPGKHSSVQSDDCGGNRARRALVDPRVHLLARLPLWSFINVAVAVQVPRTLYPSPRTDCIAFANDGRDRARAGPLSDLEAVQGPRCAHAPRLTRRPAPKRTKSAAARTTAGPNCLTHTGTGRRNSNITSS